MTSLTQFLGGSTYHRWNYGAGYKVKQGFINVIFAENAENTPSCDRRRDQCPHHGGGAGRTLQHEEGPGTEDGLFALILWYVEKTLY